VHEIAGLIELVVSPLSPAGVDAEPAPPTFLVPVEWSGRRQLVDPRHWQRWLNFAKREWPAEYEEQNFDHGSFWLRRGDVLGDPTGASEAPAEYRRAWASRWRAHVASVGGTPRATGNHGTVSVIAEIDAGAIEGAAHGERLFVDEMPDLDRPLRVSDVHEHTSTALLDLGAGDARVPLVGWTCSRLPKLE
jgi:hypothetical protein